MLEDSEFFSSPPRKTVRFGGTVAETLKKYKQVNQLLIFVTGYGKCNCRFDLNLVFLQGDTTDYDLLMIQLVDPEIKVINKLCYLHYQNILLFMLETLHSRTDCA